MQRTRTAFLHSFCHRIKFPSQPLKLLPKENVAGLTWFMVKSPAGTSWDQLTLFLGLSAGVSSFFAAHVDGQDESSQKQEMLTRALS